MLLSTRYWCVNARSGQQAAHPTNKGGMRKWKLSWNKYTMHTRFCTFGPDLHAQLVLSNKISASELIKWVCCWLGSSNSQLAYVFVQNLALTLLQKAVGRLFGAQLKLKNRAVVGWAQIPAPQVLPPQEMPPSRHVITTMSAHSFA